jgi:hypothetical protein
MRDVTVVIPWASTGDPHRDRAFERVKTWWGRLAREDRSRRWRVIVADTTGVTPWVKAAAVNAGAALTTDGVLIVADADVWTNGVSDALDAVSSGAARWAVPHLLVHRLDEASTRAVLDTDVLGGVLCRRPYGGVAGGGIVVLRREDYNMVPLDPRFLGWGQEDQAWGTALTGILGPPWRGSATLWHLWHEPQPKMTPSRGSKDGWTLVSRYWRAAKNPPALHSIIAEIRSGTPLEHHEETPIMTTWRYRNRNTGQIVNSAVRRDRLERLPNWETIAEPGTVPAPAVPAPAAAAPAAPATVTVVEETTPVPALQVAATGTVATPDPEPAAKTEDQQRQLLITAGIPKSYAPKGEWVEAALALGVESPETKTKAELIEEVRRRAGFPE